MPLFSIVMPTRNRADLLVDSALMTVLNQTFDDFEVVVGDNASTDNTEERVRSIDDPRVKYFHSPEWIPKEHFFEWSMRHAKGEYSMLFFDDDALATSALSKAYSIIQAAKPDILSYSRASVYHFQNWHEEDRQNILTIPPFTGKAHIIDSKMHLKHVFEHQEILLETPMVTNAFYKTSFCNFLLDKYGTVFPHGHMGDYNIACFSLNHTDDFIYFDDPIAIFGHWKQNTSEQLHDLKTTMPEYQEWIEWITENLLADMPVKTYQWCNCVAASLLDTKKQLNLPWDIDTAKYFVNLQNELADLEKKGIDISIQKSACFKVFSALQNGQRQEILDKMRPDENYQTTGREKTIKRTLLFNTAEQFDTCTDDRFGKQEMRIHGFLNDFSNIAEAATFYEKLSSGAASVVDLPNLERLTTPTFSRKKAAELYIKGLTKIAGEFNRVYIVGIGQIAKISAKILGSKAAGFIDVNILLKGLQILPGVPIESMDVLSHGRYDCVLISEKYPDSYVNLISKLVKDNPNNNADIVKADELLTSMNS
ncbi:MAG: glycosyltransferase family 2 protein [Proteobacteria bacterium]|nr:glycosyltransferase family 2 protein [Pseudomonadota bacterium]